MRRATSGRTWRLGFVKSRIGSLEHSKAMQEVATGHLLKTYPGPLWRSREIVQSINGNAEDLSGALIRLKYGQKEQKLWE